MKSLNLLLIFLILSFALYASFAYAQEPLVPCGGQGQNPCSFCDLMTLANRSVTFAWNFLILPLTALGILASGIVLLTSGGSQTQIEKGKSMLWAILMGFFIAASAWLIINTILGTLVEGGFGYNPLTEQFPACKK